MTPSAPEPQIQPDPVSQTEQTMAAKIGEAEEDMEE